MRRLLVILALAVCAAGCGADVANPYSAQATAPCLQKAGYAVSTHDADVGVIAASAARGGLRAVAPRRRNTLIVAFASDPHNAVDLARGYRRLAPKRIRRHLRDILSRQRNAILIWTVAPTARQLLAVQKCLT